MNDGKKQVVIIGGGQGGMSLASVLARLGYNVTLVEKHRQQNEQSAYNSCVTSKAFIHAANTAHIVLNAKQFGIRTNVEIDFNQVMSYVKNVAETMKKRDNPLRFKSYGVDVIYGDARFVGEHMLSVDHKLIPAEKFIIASGSRPLIPNIPGLEQVNYYTDENIIHIESQPKHLIIVGGGPTGLEYAQAFARLGTKVTILEAATEFMAGDDADQMNIIKGHLYKQGVDFISSAIIQKVSLSENKQITLELNNKTIKGDALFVATGRAPQLDTLGLDLVGVQYNESGIKVDSCLQSSKKHIYAIGDVIDSPCKLSHLTEYQANIVVANIALKWPKKVDYKVIPRVIYTDPEWAQVGLTEKMVKQQKISHKVVCYSLSNLDRAIISGQTLGQIKLIVRRNKLLGASILGPHAGELIHELALAMENNISLSKITQTIHAYPTWSQMHRKVVNQYFAPKFYSRPSRFLIKLLQFFR